MAENSREHAERDHGVFGAGGAFAGTQHGGHERAGAAAEDQSFRNIVKKRESAKILHLCQID
jgi:hypothetical protein